MNRIVLDLNSEAPFSSFILDNKPRLVIDVEAQKIKKVKIKETSLIIGLRIGNTDPGVFRLVFDLKKGAYIKKSFFLKKTDDKPNRIVIDLVSTEKKPNILNNKKKVNDKFIITIDPGHGGVDPGAINKKTREKNIALIAGLELKKILESYGYKVYLTRKVDKFISLSMRRKIAKKNESDLFISIHIDSVNNKATRGTSVYTLSERASDRVAAKLAERENKVDIIAGINLEEVDNEVASILLDLTRRDTKNASAGIAEKLVKKVKSKGLRLLRRPHRQAGFAVLKSPDIPSILVELGFLSNLSDLKLLKNKKNRMRILKSIGEVVYEYAEDRRKLY